MVPPLTTSAERQRRTCGIWVQQRSRQQQATIKKQTGSIYRIAIEIFLTNFSLQNSCPLPPMRNSEQKWSVPSRGGGWVLLLRRRVSPIRHPADGTDHQRCWRRFTVRNCERALLTILYVLHLVCSANYETPCRIIK